MNQSNDSNRYTEEGVREEIQRQRHLFVKLAENALTISDSLRENYFRNTAKFVAHLRAAMQREVPILNVQSVDDVTWADVQGEVVTFIDGGLGQVQISS
jgi:hypothetical protein